MPYVANENGKRSCLQLEKGKQMSYETEHVICKICCRLSGVCLEMIKRILTSISHIQKSGQRRFRTGKLT